MTELQATVETAETILRDDFGRLVGNLSVSGLAVPAHYRPKSKTQPVALPIENYEFWPIIPGPDAEIDDDSTASPIGHESVTLNLDGEEQILDSRQYLDASFGIALAYRLEPAWKARLVCYSAAGVSRYSGAIFIAQLQGQLPHKMSHLYQDALRAGFWWTDTLVEAWTEVARKIGATGVQLVPSDEIDWMAETNPELNAKIAAKYDQTARRLRLAKGETGAWSRIF
jgi:hypothetical protein